MITTKPQTDVAEMSDFAVSYESKSRINYMRAARSLYNEVQCYTLEDESEYGGIITSTIKNFMALVKEYCIEIDF